MNIDEIRELILLFDKTSIVELDVQKPDCSLRLRKPESGKEPITLDKGVKKAELSPVTGHLESLEVIEVLAPMVATFYQASAPDAEPFVKIGDRIEKGETLCILEAMKLMNEIKSEISGTIIDIPVENAEPVEYGQVLFIVEED